jgi:hypothetical protein
VSIIVQLSIRLLLRLGCTVQGMSRFYTYGRALAIEINLKFASHVRTSAFRESNTQNGYKL